MLSNQADRAQHQLVQLESVVNQLNIAAVNPKDAPEPLPAAPQPLLDDFISSHHECSTMAGAAATATGSSDSPESPTAAAGAAAAPLPATEVLISCQGLEALLFLDPAFLQSAADQTLAGLPTRGSAKPSWLVRCLCPSCQDEAGPDG